MFTKQSTETTQQIPKEGILLFSETYEGCWQLKSQHLEDGLQCQGLGKSLLVAADRIQ